MNMPAPEVLFYALLLGTALGVVFTVFEAVRLLLSLGKTVTFLADVCFCVLAAAASFILALADTGGVLRLYQVVCEGLGFSAVHLTLTYAVRTFLPRLMRFVSKTYASRRRMTDRGRGKKRQKWQPAPAGKGKKHRFFGFRLKKS